MAQKDLVRIVKGVDIANRSSREMKNMMRCPKIVNLVYRSWKIFHQETSY